MYPDPVLLTFRHHCALVIEYTTLYTLLYEFTRALRLVDSEGLLDYLGAAENTVTSDYLLRLHIILLKLGSDSFGVGSWYGEFPIARHILN